MFAQITFRGVDDGVPSKQTFDTRTVTIRINRNIECPRFVGVSAAALDENVPIGTQVTVVTATDADTVSSLLYLAKFVLQKSVFKKCCV